MKDPLKGERREDEITQRRRESVVVVDSKKVDDLKLHRTSFL
jgi:hypothetical protein